MKKQNINSIAKQFFAGSITAAVVFAGIANKANAQSQTKATIVKIDATTDDKVQVKYLSSSDEGIYFSVKYANTTASNFTLYVTDESGEILFENSYTDTVFNKKFNISRNLKKVKVFIKNEKEKLEQSFAINISTRLVEDYFVRRN